MSLQKSHIKECINVITDISNINSLWHLDCVFTSASLCAIKVVKYLQRKFTSTVLKAETGRYCLCWLHCTYRKVTPWSQLWKVASWVMSASIFGVSSCRDPRRDIRRDGTSVVVLVVTCQGVQYHCTSDRIKPWSSINDCPGAK